jgi:hypothetical protein
MPKKKGKYNHAFDIAFEVISDNEGKNVTKEELMTGLLRRVANLSDHPTEIVEACGLPFDTYLTEEDEE